MTKSATAFSITSYRKRGVRTRIFWSFFALSLALLFLFLAMGISILNDRYEEQTILSTQDMLDKASIASTIAISQTLDNIQQITQNESIISAIAVPDINNGFRSIEIVNHLKYVQQQNRYIESLYFYSNFDDAVYSSRGAVHACDNFFERDVIRTYQDTRTISNTPLAKREKYDFFVYGDQIYITYAFPVAAPYENGTIYARLSKEALSDILNLRTVEEEQYIQVYSPRNEPMLNIEEVLPDAILDQATDTPSAIFWENGTMFLCQSPSTGLKYAYYKSSLAKRIPGSHYLRILLPLITIILLVSLVMSVNLTGYLYKPIQKMMDTISGTNYPKSPGKEMELDYLGEALSDFVIRNEDLTRAIAVIRPEVEQKVFHSLILGTLSESEFNEELLQTIQLPQDSFCTVLAVQVTDAQCQPLGKLEANMCILALKQLIMGYQENSCSPKLSELENGILAVAFTFPKDTPDTCILQKAKEMAQFIHEQSTVFPCRLFTAVGGIYQNLQMLHSSYTDACQSINYQKYFRDDKTAGNKDTTPSYYRNYIISQLDQALLNTEPDQTEKMLFYALERIFQLFQENQEPLETVQMQCNGFIDLIIGIMSDLNCTDAASINRCAIEKEINSLQNQENLLHCMKEHYRTFLPIILHQQNKQQNRYITSAKNYILEHYSDYSLSLDTVAQKIGIHPNYLSRLFKEAMNINFIEYLNKYRIEKAKILLKTTRMMVKDIGFEVGFNSVQNYLRVFKKYENMTPKQYRETHQDQL